jgi:PBP1b-binding outer membrane lipoprotein LpoB
MKRVLAILICVFVFGACSERKHEEKAIKGTIDSFYECINDRNFETISEICSPQMKKRIEFIKTFGNDLVVYKKWELDSIKLNGNKAMVNVVTIDQYDNKTECIWKLIKSNEIWLLDVFNNSSADEITNKTNSKKDTQTPEPITTQP